jgi:hypothetical protein
VSQIIVVFLALALYRLLKPVNNDHAVLMVVLALLGIPIAFLNEVHGTLGWRVTESVKNVDLGGGVMRRVMQTLRWRPRVPWMTKLRPELKPKVVDNPRESGSMLVPTPLLVTEEVRRIHRGRLATPAILRQRLAARFGADQTCPLTMGILLHIVAGATEEQIAAGKRPLAPYWRVVDEQGVLNPKVPFGPRRQALHLRREGHVVKRIGGSMRVQTVGDKRAVVQARPNNALSGRTRR